MPRWTASQDRNGVLILTPPDRRSPAQAAAIAKREMSYRPRDDARSGQVERNLGRFREAYPSMTGRFGEAELRAAAVNLGDRCAWCHAHRIARVYRLPPPRRDESSLALLGPPCRRCAYRLMTPEERRAEAARLANRQRPARPRPAGSGRVRPLVASGWQPTRYDLDAAARLGLPVDRLYWHAGQRGGEVPAGGGRSGVRRRRQAATRRPGG
jgi:hypothetical protein